MATTVLALASVDYPFITDRIKVFISTQAEPSVIVASEIDATPGHPAREWFFSGLTRAAYLVEMWQISSTDLKVARLAKFDVVPSTAKNGLLVRDDEQIKPNVTPGFIAGDTEVYFDGHEVALPPSDYALFDTPTIDVWAWWARFTGTPRLDDLTTVHFLVNGFNQYSQVTHNGTWTLEEYLQAIAADVMSIDDRVVATVGMLGDWMGISFTTGEGNTTSGDVTIVNSTGSSTVTAPDYRGWNINPERRNQPGTMLRDEEYEWDTVTGRFKLLVEGDIFMDGEPYNIDFDPSEDTSGNSEPLNPLFTAKIITDDYTVLLEDFGVKLIVEPTGNNLTITLPDIYTVQSGLPLMIEVSKTTNCTVNVVQATGQVINFLNGKIMICSGESLRVYKLSRAIDNAEWRCDNVFGNFNRVGQIVTSDQIPANLIGVLALNGASVNKLQYGRLYDFVNSLPADQKPSYSARLTPGNIFLYSLDNGTEFYVPDRRSLYARGSAATDKAGTYWRGSIEAHKHISPSGSGSGTAAPFGRTGQYGKFSWDKQDSDNDLWFTNNGTEIAGANQLNPAGAISTETRPNSYSINQYVII